MNGEIDFEALARRAVACKCWRWRSGVLTIGSNVRLDGPRSRLAAVEAGAMPDLRDPATLGCLLALWIEAWPAELADRAKRVAEIQDAIADHDIGKLAEALVAALECAP